MADKERYYWDSMMFSYTMAQQHEDLPIMQHIVDRAKNGEIEIATSAFTLCEVSKVQNPDEPMTPEEQEQMIVDFFKNPYIIIVQVTLPIAALAREVARKYAGIKGKDAVHIASAVVANAKVLHTYDGDMINCTGKVGSPALKISKPTWKNGQPALGME